MVFTPITNAIAQVSLPFGDLTLDETRQKLLVVFQYHGFQGPRSKKIHRYMDNPYFSKIKKRQCINSVFIPYMDAIAKRIIDRTSNGKKLSADGFYRIMSSFVVLASEQGGIIEEKSVEVDHSPKERGPRETKTTHKQKELYSFIKAAQSLPEFVEDEPRAPTRKDKEVMRDAFFNEAIRLRDTEKSVIDMPKKRTYKKTKNKKLQRKLLMMYIICEALLLIIILLVLFYVL